MGTWEPITAQKPTQCLFHLCYQKLKRRIKRWERLRDHRRGTHTFDQICFTLGGGGYRLFWDFRRIGSQRKGRTASTYFQLITLYISGSAGDNVSLHIREAEEKVRKLYLVLLLVNPSMDQSIWFCLVVKHLGPKHNSTQTRRACAHMKESGRGRGGDFYVSSMLN